MILAENNHLLISPSYRNRFSAKQASNPSVALKQENRGITHVARQELEAIHIWGRFPPSCYDTQQPPICTYTIQVNPSIEQLLLPRRETTLGCGARDQSRTKRGVKRGQHSHDVGHHSLRADMAKLQWDTGSTACKGKTRVQRVRRTLLWLREEGRQLSSNKQVQTQKQLL